MTGSELSRRKILSAMVAAGGSGAFVGHSTVSFLSDEETFTNNSITGSEAAGGVVSINMDTGSLSSGSDENSVTFTANVPDTDSQRENPAYVCVRTKLCPEDIDTETDKKDSPDRLRVQLVLECESDRTLLTGGLREVLDMLNKGLLLSCDNDPCLEPGGSELALRLDVLTDLDIKDYNFEFELDFLAEQCRANEPTVPSEPGLFDLLGTCPTDEECPPTGGKGISWIAFCRRGKDAKSLDPVNVEIETLRTEEDSPTPTSVIWQLTDGGDVDYVVVFGGGCWTLYDYTDTSFTSGVPGVATTGGDTDYDKWLSCNNACDRPSLRGEDGLQDKNFECPNGSQGQNNTCSLNSCPCEVAEEIFGDGDFSGTSIKLEEDEGDFTEE